MNTPKVTPTIGGYTFEWESEKLTIKVNRLHIHNEGNITGEILVTSNAEGYSSPLYPQSQLNFSSARTRKELANNLKELYPTWDWIVAIDQLSYQVQELARVGEPGITIEANDDEVVPPEYLLEPVVMKGVPSVIYGDKGVHKTTLSILFIGCLSLPWTDNPFNLTTNAHQSVAAMLDFEANAELTKYTVQRLRKGTQVPYFKFHYKRCKSPLADDIEQIAHFLEDNNCNILVIDSLGAACGGDLYKPEPAIRFFEALRSLNTTSLIIAQNAKNDENKKTIFGSTYFQYYSRNIFELKRSNDTFSQDETRVALFHQESNYSERYKPMGFHLSFARDSIKVESEPVNYAEFLEKIDRQQQVLELLNLGKKNANDISRELNISKANTYMTLSRLKEKGKVIKLADDNWQLKIEERYNDVPLS